MVELSLGKQRRLQQCADEDGTFLMVAVDQRGNLRRVLNPADPAAVLYQDLVDFKMAVTSVLGPAATAVLLDPEYGAAQAIVSGSLPGSTGLVVALEATGYQESASDRRNQVLPGWSVEKAVRLGASAAKLLLYYHPDAPGAELQEELVATLAIECAAYDLPLVVEPLSFALEPEASKLMGAEKVEVVIETARKLTGIVGVDLLKAEFPGDESNVAEWERACADLTEASHTPWVLLSSGVSFSDFEVQTRIACSAGASGVLAGRAIWKEAVTMAPHERLAFLADIGIHRLMRLKASVGEHARPWNFQRSDVDGVEENWFEEF